VLGVLISWGVVGVFQKLATNYISAESVMILLIVGSFAIQPFVLPQQPLSSYSHRAVIFGLLSGLLSNLGSWGLFAAMRLGGSASIVTVLCALYPLPVALLAPLVLHESITWLQSIGIGCGILAIILISLPAPAASNTGRETVPS
jgi:bacterial/archaeal transporter family protein